MNASPWRLIHLWLAVVSSVFVLIASLTGAILAFEPIYEQAHPYDLGEEERLTLYELVQHTSTRYDEISSIKKDHNGFYQISIFSDEGESTFYINPLSGEKIGEIIKTPPLFDFARTLHRSLFFKEVGRLLVGLTSLVLILIAVVGFFLAVRKQGGIRFFFKKVIKESFAQDYHTQLGKAFILPILFISITGTLLFFVRFDIISNQVGNHAFDFQENENEVRDPDFIIFKETNLSNFKEVVFPFSDFEDDFFELKLTNRELLISQKTGAVLSEIDYSKSKLLADFSFQWHTGEGQSWWAILLCITSVSLVFFVYSGFSIYLRRNRSKSRWKNPYPIDQCDIIIAVGSELGATAEKASTFHQALIKVGVRAYIVSMNAFEYFPSMKKLIVMTSTYGKGDAPANASQFIRKFNGTKARYQSFQYAVIGFGSRSYPDFCKYAIDLDHLLQMHTSATQLLPLAKLEEHAHEKATNWAKELGDKLGLRLDVDFTPRAKEVVELRVTDRKFSKNPEDQTFLLKLSATRRQIQSITSGDLLAITAEDGVSRYYSMSVYKSQKMILLSVKRSKGGLVSNRLANLKIGEGINVSFKKNPTFHFPKKSSSVLLIANGTGIAPFLGMLEGNRSKIPTTLFWGGQNEASFDLYKSKLIGLRESEKLNRLEVAYSRTEEPKYVQQVVKENEKLIAEVLEERGVIMICGSLNMQEGVEAVLNEISQKCLNRSIDYFKDLGLVKADCY